MNLHGVIDNIPENPKEILDMALSLSFNNWVDEKGTEKFPSVWKRNKSDLTYEEAFKLIQESRPHWVFSFRNISNIVEGEKDHWDFGGCNIGGNDYGDVFIWIQVSLENAEKVFKKFNLNVKWY